MRARSTLSVIPVLSLLLSFALVRSGAQDQKPPVFKSGIDLLQLDVTVLDKDGKPIRGLTKDDFTVLEDGQPQAIEGFAEIDIPEVVHDGPAWSRDVTPDVTSNQFDNRRIFVLVLDDARGIGGTLGREGMLKTGEAIIDTLGPQDMAAIVFTMQVKKSQGLTNDRNKLLTALHAYPMFGGGMPTSVKPAPSGARSVSSAGGLGCLSNKEVLWTIRAIVEHLSTVPDRRKALLYYGGMMPWVMTPGDDPCGTYWTWREILTAAQQGHVSVNPIRPSGGIKADEDYMAVAENTGGHAVTVGDVNAVMAGVRQILVENSSYYLLAYPMTPGDPDGTFRHLSVKVNRSDVEVITRRGYWTPRAPPAGKPIETPSPDVEAIAGILPSAKLNLRATIAPFAADGGKAALAIAVGVIQPGFATRAREAVEILIKAFSADGDPKGTETAIVPITVPAARGADESRYDVLTRIDVAKPGRYEVRLVAHSAETDERGSIYLDVEVPDFAKAKVSLSGVVLSNPLSAVPLAPPRLLNDLVPEPPVTARTFDQTDRVSAYLKVYQGGSGRLAEVPVTINILDASGSEIVAQTERLGADRFGSDRAAEVRFELPLGRLEAGEYLLTFQSSADKVTARRDVVFRVK